jgi:ABC-2 type transport system permease protein
MYAVLLLGEVLFWNNLGFDRTAAQAYYVMPVKLSTVLIAKNITAVFFLLLEITIVTAVVLALQLKFPLSKIPEAFAVTLMLCGFLLAIGNLASTHYPRPVDPSNSWRSSSTGKIQGFLVLLYPVLALPVALAYLARYAFSTDLAFYAVIGAGCAVAVLTYMVSLETAVAAADTRREAILTALSRGDGPIA